jgi:glycine betaine catabolism B
MEAAMTTATTRSPAAPLEASPTGASASPQAATTTTQRSGQLAPDRVAGTGRGPLAPRFLFPLIDGVLGTRPATVLEVRAETPTISRLRLERPAGFHHDPGQHAVLRLHTDQGPDLRPLSIASPPDADELEFATRIGPSAYKQAFAALQGGDRVKVSRPMGSFRLDPTRPAVMVSGGIGITPLHSMLTAAAASGHSAPIRLLFSNRTTEEIPFRFELDQLARRHPGLRITWVLSASAAGAPSGDVLAGRIEVGHLREQLRQLPDAVFYLTGPAAMVDDLTGMLRRIGLPSSQLRRSRQTMPLSR